MPPSSDRTIPAIHALCRNGGTDALIIAGSPWPLAGREAEVAAIAAAMTSGRGVTLTGEAGIGKTRVARAALERLAADGWTTACFEAGAAPGAVPFLPFASLLRAPVHDDLGRLVEATETLVSSGDQVAALIDDVHALDDVSLAFVSHLIATTDVRLVLTVRTGDDATRLVRAWSDALPRVDVAALDRAAVDELVRVVLGTAEPSALRWIWDTTAGNPLFVRELVTDAVERGALVERDARWMLTSDSGPPGRRLRDVIVDRFGALWDAEREAVELLAIAAPIGLRLFEKLTTPEVVQELEHRGLIAADRSGRRVNVRLAHRIHGDVVREQLGPSTVAFHRRRLLDAMSSIGERRRSDRLRAALWREELGDTSDPVGLVAAAEDLMTLIDGASVSAPMKRRDAGASTGPEMLDQAARLARAALDAGEGLRAAVVLISALSRLGRHQEAHTVRAALDDLVADEADRVLVARLLAEVDSLVLGDPGLADDRLRELEAIVTAPDLLRSLRASRVMSLLTIGQVGDAIAMAQLVLEDPDATITDRVRCTTGAATALGMAGRTTEALELADRAAALAVESGDGGRSVGGVLPRVVALASAGRFDELDQLLDLCHTVSEKHGFDDGVAIFSGALANAALLRGRPVTARQWADTALEHVGAVDSMGVRHLAHAVRTQALALVGDAGAAADALVALETVEGSSAFALEDARARAWLHVANGRIEQAVDTLMADAELCAERGHVIGAVGHLHDVARLGRADLVAARVVELAVDVDGDLVPVQAARVAALVTMDADALESAAARFEEMGAALDAVESFAQAATIHRRAGRHARASAAAARSHELRQLCEGASTPAMDDAEPLLALTKREREVALLAADGLTDREIADRLVVSIRTVETHLHNAYAKLAVDGREGLFAAIGRY
jgi:DNA-binding CsgD family transcriptional regulator